MTTDEKAIEDIVKQLEITWNTYDSAGCASLFSEDATFIQIYGGQLDGRAEIEASHRCIFDTIYKGSEARFTVRSIRLLRPEVAIAFTEAKLKFHDGKQAREIDARPTLTVVKEQGKWQIAALQNTRISEMPAAAAAASRLAK
jgi:uncharacterized protein (TIGR02246 family)